MSTTNDDLKKLIAQSAQSRAHQSNGMFFGVGAPGLNRLLSYRQKSELDIPPYGYGGRGAALRRVFRLVGADVIAAAIAISIEKAQATSYTIEGPQRTVNQAQRLIESLNYGAGWLDFVARWVIDYRTQDNGAFTELIGPGQPLKIGGVIQRHIDGMPIIDISKPLEGKPVSLATLDSLACERTGVYETPIRYYDINGNMHLFHNSRISAVSDMPQPDERLFGYGFSSLSRCISMVQYAVNWSTARNESLDNMPPLSIMTLENINREAYEQELAQYELDRLSMEERVLRSLMTLVQQDPSKPTAVKLTPIRQLWESFDEQTAFQLTVNIVAMAFGLDPQDLAPLVSSSMGSGQQSTVLAEKARGKGIGSLLRQLEQLMRRVLPASVTFQFDFVDDDQDKLRADINQVKASTVLSLYTGSANGSTKAPESPNGAANPLGFSVLGNTSPTPTSLIERDEARRLLMHEIPEWADILDPDMVQREQVVVDELDGDLQELQAKMYGPKIRYNSKSRRTVAMADRRQQKQRRVVIDPITQDEIAEARQRLLDIGINVDELRPQHAGS